MQTNHQISPVERCVGRLNVKRWNNSDIKHICPPLSVPSAIHSHKPPLDEILSDLGLLKNRGKRLELFARYLMPNWTSFGNQVLKLQQRQYFIENG